MDQLYKQDKSDKDIDDLLLQHKNLVYYMLSNMGQLNNQDAESAAWEALWDSIGTFDIYGKTAFSTYACTVIRNAVNDVLRKQILQQNKDNAVIAVLTEDCPVTSMPIESAQDTQRIYELFDSYIATKTGITRSILLVWQCSNFECSATHIANMCKCSISYVCRTQQLFRAYLSSRLK